MADATQGPSAVVNQLKELWGNQSRGRRMLAILVVLGIIGAVVFTRFVKTEAGWTVVADGATCSHQSTIKCRFAYELVPPNLLEKLVLGDHAFAVLCQVHQEVEHTRLHFQHP